MRMRIACFIVLCLPVACGGAVSDFDSGTGSDGSPGSDAGTSACPASPPQTSASCSDEGLQCEYGSNPSLSCNLLFACTSGHWVDESTGSACPPQADCPASYAQVPVGQDCTDNTLACGYPEGECICTQTWGGLAKQTPAWDCFPKQDGCPSPRPDIGAACGTPDLECNYGACSGGVDLVCTGGVWQQRIIPCPS
jgi:hypothetical protein